MLSRPFLRMLPIATILESCSWTVLAALGPITAGITFNDVLANGTGCMLNIAIPQVTQTGEFAGGSNTFDVWRVSSPITNSTTWNTIPSRTTMWATMNMPIDVTTGPFQTVLMSDTCNETMSFYFQLSDWQQQAGFVRILQEDMEYGFWLTYGC
ncbi:hypothetical protein VTN77DRAFT_4010 [Rasamsonia byssochlamydoides]|uniref:uncharacterized protein n=1 Tax=Rasamsonia byssochlamydoides TaxID=89139 RepID=UPI0037446837